MRLVFVLFWLFLSAFASAQTGGQFEGQGSVETLPKALTLRLLSNPEYPEGDVTDVLIGEVPNTLPADIPLPPNTDIVGTLLYGEKRAEIVLETRDTSASVTNFFEVQLEGWRRVRLPANQNRGFISAAESSSAYFCRGENTSLGVGTFQKDALTEVRLGLLVEEKYSVCSEEERRFGRDDIPMPTLVAPDNVQLNGSGMSSDDTSAVARTVLETERPPQNLIAHYAEQLPAQGWQLGVRNQEGSQAWHTFSLENEEGNWQGYLVAITLPEEQVQLFFSVAPQIDK